MGSTSTIRLFCDETDHVPVLPRSIICYQPNSSCIREVTAGLVDVHEKLPQGVLLIGDDCNT